MDADAPDTTWEAAWARRDPAYDGCFFVGVRTTGIYCRCVCPVRQPFRRNVEFLVSAAAAERAGYGRACAAGPRLRRSRRPGRAPWRRSSEPCG